MDDLQRAIGDLVIANRILAKEEVVDAYGHVSIRHPNKPDHYLLSRSLSPEFVTRKDIIEFKLDGTIVTAIIAMLIAVPVGLIIGHTGRGTFLVVTGVNALRALPTLGVLTTSGRRPAPWSPGAGARPRRQTAPRRRPRSTRARPCGRAWC